MNEETLKHNLELLLYRGYCLIGGVDWLNQFLKYVKENSNLIIEIKEENKIFYKVIVI